MGGWLCLAMGYDRDEDGSCGSVWEADSEIKLGFSSSTALTLGVGGRSESSSTWRLKAFLALGTVEQLFNINESLPLTSPLPFQSHILETTCPWLSSAT